jgi:plasmid stabilization system protein ParE
VQVLAEFPELGSVVREFGDPAWRQLSQPPYRIIYHLNREQQTVEIVRIWHGARGDVELPR